MRSSMSCIRSRVKKSVMSGETTVRCCSEDVWEETADSVTIDEALEMLSE